MLRQSLKMIMTLHLYNNTNNFSFLASTLPSTSPTSQHRNDHHQAPTESLEETFRGSHYSVSPRDHSVKEYLHKKPPHDLLRGRQRSRSEEVDLRMQLKEEKERRRTGQGFGKDEQRRLSRHSHRSGSCGASVSGIGGGSVDKSLDSTLSLNQASSGGVIHQLSVELNRLHAAIAKAESLKQTRLLELKAVEETLVGNKTEAKHGEQVLKQTRAQAEEKRSELMLIEFKRDAAQKEIRALCEEVDRRKAQIGTLGDLAVKERQAMKNASLAQEQVETLQCDAEQLQLRLKTLESAERERIELEKQLSSTKENLFAEQRRSREKIESFREDLEHHQLQLEEAIKEKEALQMKVFQFESRVQQIEREKNAIIEEKGEEMGKLQQKLAERLSDARTHNSREMTDLKVQLKDARSKVNEATNQKQEIEMKGENLREKYDNARSALSKLSQEVEQLKGKQEKQLEDILQQKDTELASLRLAAEQDKEAALAALSQQRDQIASQIQMKLREDLAALQKQLTAKEVEATVLKERLKEQDDTTRHLNDTIRQEVKDNMQSTIEKERIKIERDLSELYKSKMAAIQDQANKTVFSLEEQMKVEREGTLQLQTMVNNIKQELDDARRQSHSLYNDKLTAIQQAKDTAEHDRERQLERMKEKIEQDYQRQIGRLTETNRTQGEELERLRAEREVLTAHEREQTDEAGRLERSVVQEANDECKKMADFTGLPPRITTAQGLNMNWSSTKGSYNQTIRSAIPIAISNMKHSGEEIRKVVTSLRNDLNNQKIKMSRVEQDKPADHTFHMPVSASTGPSSESHAPSGLAHSGSLPSVGQFHSGSQAPHVRHSNSSPNYVHTSQTESLESLRMRLLQEKQQSMDSLKDRLIKEHVHEVDRLHKTLSHAPKLSRSLKEKDSELKEIVRNMSSWKDQTADKLASKFQKEMDREIERQEPIKDNSRHVRDFERKERAWEREKVSQQRDIERLESEIQKPKIMSRTVSPTYRSPVKCFHDDQVPNNQVPNNKLGVHDDDNVERLHTLQSKMSLLQRENDNLKHMNGTLGKPAEMHNGNVSGLQAYNDTIPTRDVSHEHTLGSPAPKVLEQRLGMAERRARMSEQRADQNEQLLNQKILEMTKLQGTLSQQSKELMQVERAYSHLHTTLSGSPITSRSPSRSDSRIGSRHGSRPSSLPNSRPSSRNSHPVSTR